MPLLSAFLRKRLGTGRCDRSSQEIGPRSSVNQTADLGAGSEVVGERCDRPTVVLLNKTGQTVVNKHLRDWTTECAESAEERL